MEMHSSDRKKVMALPFYLAKRSQDPEPRMGQYEFELFERLYGFNWYDDARIIRDEEHKITEFDYENHIDTSLFTKEQLQSEDFKHFIKVKQLLHETELERLQNAKENFKNLMPILRVLTNEEKDAFIHKL